MRTLHVKYNNAYVFVIKPFLAIKHTPTSNDVRTLNNEGDSKGRFVDTTGWVDAIGRTIIYFLGVESVE
ncbi:MAG: hypothetical protein M0R40_04195 [Firmicutes bacterium]|nr:hypothetical protein [Bacillota bacterium]